MACSGQSAGGEGIQHQHGNQQRPYQLPVRPAVPFKVADPRLDRKTFVVRLVAVLAEGLQVAGRVPPDIL